MASEGNDWPRWCSLCNVKLINEDAASKHYTGKKHKTNMEGTQSADGKKQQHSPDQERMASEGNDWPRWCSLCNVKLINEDAASKHYTGKKHKTNMEGTQSADGKKQQHSPVADYPNECQICNKRFSSNFDTKEHFECNTHKKKLEEVTKQDESKSHVSNWPKWCTLCNVKLGSQSAASTHYTGKKHRSRAESKTGVNIPKECSTREERTLDCTKKESYLPLGSFQHSSVFSWASVPHNSTGMVSTMDQSNAFGHNDPFHAKYEASIRKGTLAHPSSCDKNKMPALNFSTCTSPARVRQDALSEVNSLSSQRKGISRLSYSMTALDKAGKGVTAEKKHQTSNKDNQLKASRKHTQSGQSSEQNITDSHKNRECRAATTETAHYDELISPQIRMLQSAKLENMEENIRAVVKNILSNQRPDDILDLDDLISHVRQILLTKTEQSNSPRAEGKQDSDQTGESWPEVISNGTKSEMKNIKSGSAEEVITRECKEKEYLSSTVDENAVFQFVIKTYSGQCEIGELKNKAQHLFPPGFDVLSWLMKSKLFKVFQRRDSSKLDESVVFVKLDRLQLCRRYAYCNVPNCPYIHFCSNLLTGSCSQVNCPLLHSLSDEHNSRVLKGLHIKGVFTEEEILSILRCCTLFVCSRWNTFGHCNLSKIYTLCPYLHVCQYFILGTCKHDNCKLGHSFDTPTAKLLFGPAYYNLHKVSKKSLCKAILLPKITEKLDFYECKVEESHKQSALEQEKREDMNSGKQLDSVTDNVIVKPRQSIVQGEETGESNFGHKTEIIGQRVEEPKVKRHIPEREPPREKSDKWTEISLFDDGTDRFICEDNLRRQCRNGPSKCTKHHYPLPYVWQIMVDGVWEIATENSSIEAAFCDVKCDQFTYYLEHGVAETMVTIDFSTFKCINNNTKMPFSLRRLSTESYMEAPERHDYHTTWIWYWQDEYGQWIPYEVDDLPYQDVVEAKYLAKQVAFLAEINHHPYMLDLRNMLQINRETGKQRRIKRRPQMVTAEEVLLGSRKVKSSIRHFDKTLLPSGWAPMNTRSYTTPDLILLDEQSSDFTLVYNKFFATMDLTEFSIDHIFKIQNLALWDKYLRKKREMQQNTHLKGDVNEKYLFHGTSSEEVVRCICKEGFDWRVCGKNGTLYGNGSYFARDASYSNNYSLRQRSGKQEMFLSLVLIGAYTKGARNVTRPPQSYNSCVDNENNPNIYVVFHDDQSYPEYLIEYTSK